MKYFRLLLVLAILIVGVGFAQRPAQAGAFTYNSSINLQNLSGSVANITIHFYLQDGSEDPLSPVIDTIDAGGSKQYFPIPVSEGFNGSVVIESDQLIASVSNILGNVNQAAASYVGSSSGGSPVLLPLLMKDNSGYNTWFNVQNAGGSDANVEVAYSDGETASAVVPAGAAFTFDQTTETHPDPVFSAIVTADQPIAATVIEENSEVMFAYSGFIATTDAPVFPLVNENNSGYITGINIQNVGDVDTEVTVTYTPSAFGNECTETQTIAAGQSNTFALYSFAGVAQPGMTTTCVKERFVGSGKVTVNDAGMALNGVVNQLKPGVNGEAYGAFSIDAATGKVVLPLIMNANSGYWTSINLMNVGDADTTVECNFTPYNDVPLPVLTTTLAPGEGISWLQKDPSEFGDTKYIGSATCEAPGGLIVAVVNELGASNVYDQLLVYEGFNVAP